MNAEIVRAEDFERLLVEGTVDGVRQLVPPASVQWSETDVDIFGSATTRRRRPDVTASRDAGHPTFLSV